VAPFPRLSDLPNSTSLTQLLGLVGSIENDQLDFKREPARLKDLVPAFAMTEGGLILIGVNDDRTVHGCELTQKVADTITRAAKEVGVDVQLRQIEVDGSPIVVVAVPEVTGRIVTTSDGRLLRRVGSEIHPLIGDQLARFVRERAEIPGEEEALPQVSVEDFDLTLINQALTLDGREPVSPAQWLRALVDLDVAIPQPTPADPRVTVAAIVLYAKDPRRLVSGASVQLVRRTGVGPGTGPTKAREELSGPISQLVDQCLAFISAHTTRYQVVIGARRAVWPEYPEEVLREGLLNAFAHRDYGRRGTTVDVTIWDDRIDVRSPGGLPGPITLENIREEHYSRNRRIMRALKLLGLVEEYGEGIDRMYEFMDARLMEPPAILPTRDSVTVTLRNRFLVSVDEQVWLSLLGHLNLTNHERRALAIAHREGAITRRRILQLIPDANAEALLRGAVAKGLLNRTGHAGGAKYELSQEVVMRAGASGVEAQARKRQMLFDEVQRRGSLSTAEGAALLEEDHVLVRHLLNDLAASGLVIARGQTRGRRYFPA
jgi:ATP-dependent DNA helicase RecG